ncbi:MAG: hypothetical protein L0Y72_11195 [Gemmataceae bacterium]|nr:hypothetical protein [Gemmataceae bacterium]MCI0739602.1 hypothetical protein [Gemmataceae bacterium]
MFKVLSMLSACAFFVCGQPPCSGQKVKVTVVCILAKEEPGHIDKKLVDIAKEVQLKNPSLKSFYLKNMEMRSLAPDEKGFFPLVNKKSALVIVKHGADKYNKVGLVIHPPDQGEILCASACGKFLPIVTRYETKDKQRLILAIRVQPCKE